MKLISLNIWGGKVFAPLMKFIEAHAANTDIFCFQEVFHSSSGPKESHGARMNVLDEIIKRLPDFSWYFLPAQDHYVFGDIVDFDIVVGKAIFVRNTIDIESEGSEAIYRETTQDFEKTNIPANLHYLRFFIGDKKITICNFHGMAFPGNKLDTPQRILQSEKLREFLDGERGAKILCGDFNLLPNDKSVALLEEKMTDLIKKFDIRETRGKLSLYYGTPMAQHFADLMFVSPDVRVLNFAVPDAGVSDHMPMILDFE